jgi:site-specific DNA-methyltransferase (adenine-specific)
MKKKQVQAGEIWKLGEHVLGCGSATDEEFVGKVMKNIKGPVRMILTDPPYGVAYVEGKKDFAKLGKESVKVIMNDHLQTEEEYSLFTADWMNAIKPHLDKYNAAYIFNSDLMFRALRNGIDEAGFYYSQMLIWVKNTVVVGRKDYLPMHEVVAYCWYGRHKMNRPKSKSIIFHPKPASSKLHPTMKPVGLLRKIIPNNTKTGEIVYDPFGGSGSTLIASEHMGRRCVMVEMDPGYCATIIARWEQLTGKQAERL